ncbi:MAG: hypothetical protein ACRDH5_17700, partial [bacterium]
GSFAALVTVRSGVGLVPLSIEARSEGGARGAAGLLVAVDTDAPLVTVIDPRPGSRVPPSVTLKVEAFDDRPGVRIARVLVNGLPVPFVVTPDAATGGLVLLVDAAGLPHGAADIAVEVVDGAGNAASTSTQLLVDATPPVLTPLIEGPRAPRQNWFTGSFTVDLAAQDPETGLVSSEVALAEGAFGPPPLTISSLGPHELRLSATNGVGLRELRTLVVGIDAQAPVIDSVRSEERGGERALIVTAHDDVGIESVEALVGSSWDRMAAVGDEFVLALPEGLEQVEVRATDPAGNTQATSFKVRQSDAPVASWFSVVLVLGLLSLGREARRWR